MQNVLTASAVQWNWWKWNHCEISNKT